MLHDPFLPRARYLRMHLSAEKAWSSPSLLASAPASCSNGCTARWAGLPPTCPKSKRWHSRAQALVLPDAIALPAIGENLRIVYTPTAHDRIALSYRENASLHLSGAVADPQRCCLALQGWLKGHARQHLGVLLQQAAQETGLPYSHYRVKGQQSRWGSCSTLGNINLNYKLMLLPAEWVRYTLIHELCHTVEMNHSRRFWALVAQFVPEYKAVHAQMKNAMAQLPGWVNVS
ncbi:MAG: M48 family metallopeptidase [Candidatus Thiothrix singaporensis]|uniref:M48 family metallopeptidase n=1 Tax=Candidatus Thiothrix singaporensis TaxID=2799669 RepID=A0A7L6AML4_9GAMM|nr:MAG: M48 family metallopeptidase [Candidatus Thiothrix singaporensis]